MENINLTNLQVVEINNSDLQSITGGTWLSYALGYICGKINNALQSHGEVVAESANAAAVVAYK
jgi:hypothetical protein